jgi:hypothetical protein
MTAPLAGPSGRERDANARRVAARSAPESGGAPTTPARALRRIDLAVTSMPGIARWAMKRSRHRS